MILLSNILAGKGFNFIFEIPLNHTHTQQQHITKLMMHMHTRRTVFMIATYALVSASAFVFHRHDKIDRRSMMGGYDYDVKSSSLCMVVEIGPTDDDVEPALPGMMKISEIKSGELYPNLEYLDMCMFLITISNIIHYPIQNLI